MIILILFVPASSISTIKIIEHYAFELFASISKMKANIFSLGCLSALATLSASFPTQYQYEQGDSSCTNGPWTRSCWKPGFNIAVNSDLRFPDTGKTVVVIPSY